MSRSFPHEDSKSHGGSWGLEGLQVLLGLPLLDAIRWESSKVMRKKTWWKAFFAAGEDVVCPDATWW